MYTVGILIKLFRLIVFFYTLSACFFYKIKTYDYRKKIIFLQNEKMTVCSMIVINS